MGVYDTRFEFDEWWMESFDEAGPHPEEADASWATQVLPRGRRQHVTTDLVDIERYLPDRLACVEQVGDAVATCDVAHLPSR